MTTDPHIPDLGGPGSEGRPTPERPPEFDAFRPTIETASVERFKGPLWVLLLTACAGLFAFAIGYLGYNLDQDTHRIVKLMIVPVLGIVVLIKPEAVLMMLPFTFPYVEWLPKAPIPAVNTLNMIMLSLGLSWVGRTVFQRKLFLEPNPWNRWLGLFLVWAFITSMVATLVRGGGVPFLGVAIQQFWIGFVGFCLFFVVYNNIRSMRHIQTLAFLFCLGVGVGSLGLIMESADYGGGRRVGGGIGDINRAGSFFAASLLFVIEMFTNGFRRGWQRLFLIGGLIGGAIGVGLPASRGAIVGLAIGLVPQVLRAGPLRAFVIIAFVGVLVTLAPEQVTSRFQSTLDAATSTEGGGLNESSGNRLDIWETVIGIIQENPILGVGYGRLSGEVNADIGRMKSGHNLYLEIAAEQGVPGLFFTVMLFLVGLRHSHGLLRFHGFPRALALGYQSYIICLMIANIFGVRLLDFSNSGSFALLTALVFRARQLLENEERDLANSGPQRPLIGPPEPIRRPLVGPSAARQSPEPL